MVTFADGSKVVYKPRDIRTYALFRDVVGQLSQRVPDCDLRTAATVTRDGYGWLEAIGYEPLAGPVAAAAFYRRAGILLAGLYALNAVDIHAENLIASGDQPVLVDVEALLHPSIPVPLVTADDPAEQALEASVHRTGLLPCVAADEHGVADRSGLGGPGEADRASRLDWDPPATDTMRLIWRDVPVSGLSNRPRIGDEVLEPADYEAAVLEGFRLGYEAIARDKEAFAKILQSRADIEVRLVIRASSGYVRLLDESTHPDLLHDARDRERALAILHEVSANHPLWRELASHEVMDLWAGDIPLMTGRPASRDIWTSSGIRLPDMLERSGLRSALDKITAMGDVDRRDQEWIISAALACRRPAGGHDAPQPTQGAVTAIAATPGRLLATACGLADQLVARGMATRKAGQSRVNWIALQLVDRRWMVLPMGAGLADGYLGVALFLAQLAELTGVDRYADVARRAVSSVPQLLDALASGSDLLSAVGCGVTEGLGGISYGLARIATLLSDSAVRDSADAAVALAARAVDLPAQPAGWAEGTAGCLAAMAAVRSELGSAAAGNVATECADRLADLVERTDGRCAGDGETAPQGFINGPAGIGWALTQFASARAGHRYAQSGRRALQRVDDQVAMADHQLSPGWCSGSAGLLVARARLAGRADLQSAARLLTGRSMLRNLSLCHGELGIADALTVVASRYKGVVSLYARRRMAGQILGAINHSSSFCGTPGGIESPGLLSGLAGIGYGLLRLGFAERVPSVLFLESANSHTGSIDPADPG
jgi:type 2 lantibiotic biosynthesis protein LanM